MEKDRKRQKGGGIEERGKKEQSLRQTLNTIKHIILNGMGIPKAGERLKKIQRNK